MKRQHTYRGGAIGWFIVATRIAEPRSRDERWEVELTDPVTSHTRLYYHPTLRAARRHLRGLGVKPLRRTR